jgi:hypothetical protein
MFGSFDFCLPTRGIKVPERPEWIHEVKYELRRTKKVAALPPIAKSSLPQADLPKALQAELRRVGCLTGNLDGDWNTKSRHSLALFNTFAGTKFDLKLASQDALDGIKAKPSRVCPLVCDYGFKVEDDHCVKINCGSGFILNRNNECEKEAKQKQPSAKREEKFPESNNGASPAGGSSAAAAAAGGGCDYDACLTRCHRNSGPGSGCTNYCSGIMRILQ